LTVNSATALAANFVRRTALAEDEYRVNFKQIDCDVLDALASDEACAVTPSISRIYIRLIRSPLMYWEREGVLHFVGEEREGKALTAWEQMREMIGVSNSTLSKALAWMHEAGVIGYDARKNGVGIRIFFNRAASSIRRRAGQKNLRLVPAPSDSAPAPENRAAFKERKVEEDLESVVPPAQAREKRQPDRGIPPRPVALVSEPSHSPNLHPLSAPPAKQDRLNVDALILRIVAELRPEISAAVRRESDGTREWLLNHGLPKATRVAQRETYDLLRSYGVIVKKAVHSGDVGRNVAEDNVGREMDRLASALARARAEFRRVIAAAAESDKSALPEACRAADRELCGLHDRIIAGERPTPNEVEGKLEAVEDEVAKALWAATDPADRENMLKNARAELRGYEARMERDVFEETVRKRVTAKLRERFALPRISLFYIQ
jgi:hypothetical protein